MTDKGEKMPVRRSKSSKVQRTLLQGTNVRDRNGSEPIVQLRDRPKKTRREKFRSRFSLNGDKDKDAKKEENDEPRTFASRKISIGADVAFSHKEHVGKEDANQFLLKLLKLRQERYMEMHQQIRDNICSGYIHLRPPAHSIDKFYEICTDESKKKV